MKINKDKGIGTVIFVVEGQKFEFSILKQIFLNIFGFEYIYKKRGQPKFYQKGKNPRSKIYLVNSSSSNLGSIDNTDYLDHLYQEIGENYHIDIDDAAIFFLFDRDPKSNTDSEKYKKFHEMLIDPWENADDRNGGQLLLSYPCLESYEVSCFYECEQLQFGIGHDLKEYIAKEENCKILQLNKIKEDSLIHATQEFFNYIRGNGLVISMDDLGSTPMDIFCLQEKYYADNSVYQLLSLLTIAFLQLGLIEIEDEFQDVYISPQY